MKNTIPAAVAALAATTASAQPAAVSFDVDSADWGLDSELVFDIDFVLGEVASIDSVVIELAHSWASDLDLALTASDGSVFDITSDNGSGVDLGDGGSSLDGVATYTFVEAAGNGTWAALAFNADAPGGTYDAESWQSGPFAAGGWNIRLDDDAAGDDGAVGRVTINYTAVPAPASLALLGIGGLASARRRG